MALHDDLIIDLARRLGVASSYKSQTGFVQTDIGVQRALIEAMGYPAHSLAHVRESLARLAGKRHPSLAPWLVRASGAAGRLDLPDDVRATMSGWRLSGDDGSVLERKEAGGVTLPALAPGYYDLAIDAGGTAVSTLLLVSEPRCYLPDVFATDDARGWGLTAQVYGLKSDSNLGIGDLSDVARLATASGRCGASFLGLSPLHALFQSDRTKISPYSPSTRLFLETLYLDPSAIDVPGLDLAPLSAELAPSIAQMRAAGLVDYAGVWSVKKRLLERAFEAFRASGGQAAFEARRAAFGEPLELHATFEALSEHFLHQGHAWPGVWPADYFDPTSASVAKFRRDHQDKIAFHAWLQVMADDQLARAGRVARDSGMEIGLYRDLAVGADRFGSEVWANPERYALALSVGAPPDPLGPQGQNWGFPPFDPIALEDQKFAGFRDLVASNMRHAGAIRIDHAFQLQRLFLVPPGQTAAGGGYVAFPFEAMLAVLRIESHRHRCMVIAEDLGTNPQGFSEAIMQSGILSYRILSFERTRTGDFQPPSVYPRAAMAAITTHDLPTFKGWLRGYDIDLRSCFAVYDEKLADAERVARKRDVAAWREALQDEQLSGALDDPAAARSEALRYLARAPSMLLAVQCEDVLDELNQANLPGPSDGHPNWRRRLGETIEEMSAPGGKLARTGAVLSQEGRSTRARESALSGPPPRATYRLQFHAGFTFDQACEILPYLAELGVSHVYASPIQAAQKGSTHGYDVIDPRIINPELGGEAAFERFVTELRRNGLKLLLDIVPNHMGVGADNPFWFSVLQWGEDSPHADVFDIDWRRPGAGGKLVLPVLGAAYGDALRAGELKLAFDQDRSGFVIAHHDAVFPVCPRDFGDLLRQRSLRLGAQTHAGAVLKRLAKAYEAVADLPDAPARAGSLERGLAALSGEESIERAIEETLEDYNSSARLLDGLIKRQAYRLAHWRLAASELNYRRFFEINTLGGVRVEDPRIFELTHALILRLAREGKIDGLRIDHIDGLADPGGYLEMLQAAVGPGFYVVAEKILEPGEDLRDWPISGTTGYDALNEIDGLLVDRTSRDKIETLYRDVVGVKELYHDALVAAKKMCLERSFGSESQAIVQDLLAIAQTEGAGQDLSAAALGRAVAGFVVGLPVYRTYAGVTGADDADRRLIAETLEAAQAHVLPGDDRALRFLGQVLCGDLDPRAPELARRARLRVEQLTGPVMAKSLEDTLFYRHAPVLALNEVGGDPEQFGLTRAEFDKKVAHRAQRWPGSMIATSTHDTKRGEDARARLFALTADADAWRSVATRFLASTEGPDANDRYLLAQTLIGAWPAEWLDRSPAQPQIDSFRERCEAFFIKALREAKRHSSWTDPDEAYESAAKACLAAVLRVEHPAFAVIQDACAGVAVAGAMNGMARTILKATLPGVPDFYQGTEVWDFSMVDPDNRRPVDFASLAQSLRDEQTPATLLADWRSGRVKQFTIRKLLQDRAARPDLYAFGDYQPRAAEQGVAFERAHEHQRLYVHVPLGTRLAAHIQMKHMPGPEALGPAKLQLPAGKWRNLLTGSAFDVRGEAMFADFADGLPWLILGTSA
ncbi:MAG: malto-oligosyltrehalose synthase [Beijerinckiaceae bacterium]|nr:malto-oligosyltrehalose synthase [Beijerinckiaceae bacterium]